MSEDSFEIDLRPYILAVVRKWWLIALIAILFAGAAFAYYATRPAEFSTTASILLTRSRSSLSLTEEFTTVPENIVDYRSRLDALVTLTNSEAIAKRTFDAVKDQLGSEGITLESIKNKVQIGNKGDLILISATARKAILAATIANAWARNAVQTINLAYSGEQPLSDLETQLTEAEKEYTAAQSELETFIRGNNISTLERNINDATLALTMLEEGQAEYQDLLLTSYYERVANLEKVIIQGQSLREQIKSADSSLPARTGDALAVLLARARTFGLGQDIVLQPDLVELSTLVDSPSKYIADLDVIIRQAAEEKTKTEAIIDEISKGVLIEKGNKYLEAVSDPTDPHYQATQEQLDTYMKLEPQISSPLDDTDRSLNNQIENTADQIRDLSARLESEKAHELQLTSKRDIAWQAYDALARKVTEIESATKTNNLVTIASQAVTPLKPTTSNLTRSTIIAALLGVILAIIGVILFQWWKLVIQPTRHESTSIKINSTTK